MAGTEIQGEGGRAGLPRRRSSRVVRVAADGESVGRRRAATAAVPVSKSRSSPSPGIRLRIGLERRSLLACAPSDGPDQAAVSRGPGGGAERVVLGIDAEEREPGAALPRFVQDAVSASWSTERRWISRSRAGQRLCRIPLDALSHLSSFF